MNFSEFETKMHELGMSSLAEISRFLDTTPQAVSNWKARGHVPHHIVTKVNTINPTSSDTIISNPIIQNKINIKKDPHLFTITDILLTIVKQLKVVLLTIFVTVFTSFTYVQFIQSPIYQSSVSVLLPENQTNSIGGLAGLASQFGVNMPTGPKADLSSPSLFPELLNSRTFAEKILEKKFYTKRYGEKLTLLSILTHGNSKPKQSQDILLFQAVQKFKLMIKFEQNPKSTFSVIRVNAFEPVFAKELTELVLIQLEELNRFYKNQSVNEKIDFIDQRISSVKDDLEKSEQLIKIFNEQNRQISSPSLTLEQDRLERNVEIQRGIFLTLKQELELAKIEEVQSASIVQVLDKPQIPLGPINKNIILTIFLSSFVGAILGIGIGFFRSYLDNNDLEERKKIRRVKSYFKKKAKDVVLDSRVSGISSILLISGLPFYLTHESNNPSFFGRYSSTAMFIITIYLLILLSTIIIYIRSSRRRT